MKRILTMILFLVPIYMNAQSIDQLSEERTTILQLIDSLEQRLNEIDIQLTKVNPEDKLEAMISKYGKNKGKLIASGKVWASISPQMAIDSWGEPEKIQKSDLSNGTTEKWTYPEGKYLFFKNGRLESWKD